MQGNSDSGIRKIFACGILGSRIRKTAQAIRNPINDWNPETTPCGIQNPRLSWIPMLLSWSAEFGIYTQELVNLVVSNQVSFLKQSVYSVSINKRKHFKKMDKLLRFANHCALNKKGGFKGVLARK